MNGVLIVDKPARMTSHDAVAICRRALGVKRIGHAGTLDPDATGVLVLGVGRATRLLQFLSGDDKEYVTDAILGVETTTYDASGEVVREASAGDVALEDVEKALSDLRGSIRQVPPMVSAIKVGGERLYKKALRGEDVEREARTVVVHALDVEEFEPGARARVRLRVRCSKGTYVRSLVHDLGRALGVGAHIATLRRTASGAFTLEDAVQIDDVSPSALRSMTEAVAHYPQRNITAPTVRDVIHGKPLPAGGIDGVYALVGPDGALVAMAEDRGEHAKTLCVVAGP